MTTLLILLALVAIGAMLWTPSKPMAELKPLYAQPPSQFLMIVASNLHLRDTGPRDAPVIIMLHGLASSLHTWDRWAERLSEEYRVIRYDAPGYGLTGPDPNINYGPQRTTGVLSGLMDVLGIRKATLIGNAIGGETAWQFAARFPERVERLVLIAPCDIGYTRKPQVRLGIRILPLVLPRWVVRRKLRLAYGDPSRVSAETVRRYRDLMLLQGNRRALKHRFILTILQYGMPDLANVMAPTLLLWGEKDRLIPPSFADRFTGTLPRASLVVLPGLGHMPQEEDPDASLPPVEAFLSQEP